MDGWMNYRRMRACGARADDLDRMERDYLEPSTEGRSLRQEHGVDPATQASIATGVDLDTVRRVLGYVFKQQP